MEVVVHYTDDTDSKPFSADEVTTSGDMAWVDGIRHTDVLGVSVSPE